MNKYLYIIFLSLLSTKLLAHDLNLYSSVIVYENNEWQLKMTFGSGGLLTAMGVYFDDENLQLNQSDDFKKQVVNYLQSHIDIKVNKYFDIEMEALSIVLTEHASEIIFKLNVPPRPEYWDISILACKENERTTHMLRMIISGKSNLFKLSKKDGLSILLIQMNDGNLKRLMG